MKNFFVAIVFAVFLGVSGNAAAQAQCPKFELDNKAFVKQKLISGTLTPQFNVWSDGKFIGSITQAFFSWGRTFFLRNTRGTLIAEARQRVFTWGVQIEVVDCNKKKIGLIKENIWRSWFSFYSLYELFDAGNSKIATSEKSQLLTTAFRIRDLKGAELFYIHRPFFTGFTDRWDIATRDEEAVDPRIVVMIPAYKSVVDQERRAEAAEKRRESESQRTQ